MTQHVVLSGGLDSTGVLALALDQRGGEEVTALGFDYGQTHVRELEAAQSVADSLGVHYRVFDLGGIMRGSSLVGDGEIPDGEYAEETMASTVVHGRNLLFASVAVASSQPGDSVWMGVHAGDHHLYPDCRPEFWEGLAAVVEGAYSVRLRMPFLYVTKGEGLRRGSAAGAPYSITWSCYRGGARHCGACGTCIERKEAFAEAGLSDPTEYEK